MDRKTRKEQFYLNRLSPLIDDKSCFAKSPLEAIVETQQYELLLHPVMKALIKIKWKKFAKFNALTSVMVNFALVIFWTALMCTRPIDKKKMYADSRKYWGSILEGIAATTLIINVILEILDFFKSLRRIKCYKKWREKEIRKDLKFCHDYWPEERIYLKREIRGLKCHSPSYMKDYWNIFDWITYSLMGLNVFSHLLEFKITNTYTMSATLGVTSAMMVCMWLRLLKYARPFKALGVFVVMTGYVVSDALKILFLAAHIFIPYMAAFWINFGMSDVDGYSVGKLQLFYNLFQMAIVGDYSFDNIANHDRVMAEILCTSYIFLAGIVCLNLFIAMMSNTFQRVYDNAKANALMQRAVCIVNKENSMSQNQRLKQCEWISENCAPQSCYYNEAKINHYENELMKMTHEISMKLDEMNKTIESKIQSQFQHAKQDHKCNVLSEAIEANAHLAMIDKLKYECPSSTTKANEGFT